jgi:serine/threonine protein kinase
VRHLSYLKKLRDSGFTRLQLVKDIQEEEYYVEKSLVITGDFQEKLFENEIKMHSMFDHRYVIRFIERTETFKFLMEYAPNGNLENYIISDVDEELRIKFSLQFLTGLAYVHESGYAHNDIKPSNILVSKENRAQLADFAFAGKIGQVSFEDSPDFFKLGTDFFRRPQMAQSPPVNLVENDIYAAGVVLYLLFSRGKERKAINLEFIQKPFIRTIIRDCLNGNIKEVNQIITALKEGK